LVGNDTAEPWIWRGEPYLGRGEEQPGQCGSSVCFLPTELGAIELKIRTLNAINERYRALMGLDTSLTKGNAMYQFLHTDLDPLLDRVNQQLALTSEQRAQCGAVQLHHPGA
jgi:hypothetical protein